MTEKKQPFGDPLAMAAQTGVLGRRRITSSEDPGAAVGEGVAQKPPEPIQVPAQVASADKTPDRRKKTILMTPSRARWLKIQSADENRDMSAIAEDAFALYERFYKSQQ